MRLYCDRHVCYFCGLVGEESKTCRSLIEVHHIIEKSDNGSNEPSNLVSCCSNCHSRIHNSMITLDKWYNFGFAMKLKWTYNGKEQYGRGTIL